MLYGKGKETKECNSNSLMTNCPRRKFLVGYRRHLSDGLGSRIYDSETKLKNEKLRYSGVVLLFHRHIT